MQKKVYLTKEKGHSIHSTEWAKEKVKIYNNQKTSVFERCRLAQQNVHSACNDTQDPVKSKYLICLLKKEITRKSNELPTVKDKKTAGIVWQ